MQKICVVIPCYNEAQRLNVQSLSSYLIAHSNVTFLGVNDGSRDNTLEVLESIHQQFPERFHCFDMPENSGKAEAVRAGMLQAMKLGNYDYIGYWDADFSTTLDELDWFIHFSGGSLTHDIIMGCRVARLGSHVQRKIFRHYLGRVFSTVTSNMLNLRVYDTQCGAKLFRTTVVPSLFSDSFTSKWFFDVEILARCISLNGRDYLYSNALEIPLKAWYEIKGSKLKWSDFMKVPLELLKIKRRYQL